MMKIKPIPNTVQLRTAMIHKIIKQICFEFFLFVCEPFGGQSLGPKWKRIFFGNLIRTTSHIPYFTQIQWTFHLWALIKIETTFPILQFNSEYSIILSTRQMLLPLKGKVCFKFVFFSRNTLNFNLLSFFFYLFYSNDIQNAIFHVKN